MNALTVAHSSPEGQARQLWPVHFVGEETKDMGGDPEMLGSTQDSKLPQALNMLAPSRGCYNAQQVF